MADISEALEALGITEDDFYREAETEIEQGLDDMAEDVRSEWVGLAPEDTGEYKSEIELSKIHDDDGRSARRVGDYAEYAHFVEYGTEDTPEFGVRAKVAQRFDNEGKYMV